MGSRLIKAEDIISRQIGDEIVVLRDDGLSVHVLNKTAAHVWEMCDGNHELDEIALSLCKRFAVAFAEASADVQDTISKLEELCLLKRIVQVLDSNDSTK